MDSESGAKAHSPQPDVESKEQACTRPLPTPRHRASGESAVTVKATVTFDEQDKLPVLTLTTESATEDRDLSLLTAFKDVRIMLELDASDEFVCLNRSR